MPRQHIVDDMDMSFRALWRSPFVKADILHLHWLEKAFWGRRTAKAVATAVMTMIIVRLLKLRGTRIVWTAHNPEPHSKAGNANLNTWPLSAVWRVYLWGMIGALDGVIFLSESQAAETYMKHPRLAKLPYAVTPHPHYREVYKNSISAESARARLGFDRDNFIFLFAGGIMPYKGVEDFITAFRALAAPQARLIIAGRPDSPNLEHTMRQRAGDDSRILLNLSFVPDDELQVYFNAADLAVFPFRKVANSGSVLLGLSFNRPVAVTAMPVFQELRDIVGPDWVYVWKGAIDAQSVADAMQWVQASKRAAAAPLDALNGGTIAERTSDFYLRLLARHRGK
jgi:beta-1,4-mannosyltransferase